MPRISSEGFHGDVARDMGQNAIFANENRKIKAIMYMERSENLKARQKERR
jgi:hypothetical protein